MFSSRIGLHSALCLSLIFFYGSTVLSLSADFPHHFAIIDELMRNGASNAPRIGDMWGYPLASHWIGAGVGCLVGSGLVAMWLVCIVSIYVCYYCFAWLAGGVGAVLLVLLVAASSFTLVVVGFEVVGNFFYAQIVATAIYAATLLVLVGTDGWNPVSRSLIVLGLFAFMLEVHTLPALHMAVAFGLLLALEMVNKLDRERFAAFGLFLVGGLLVLLFNRSFRAMMFFAQTDGGLLLGRGWLLLLAFAITLIPVSAWLLWRKVQEGGAVSTVDLVVFAALSGSTGLIVLQFAAFQLFGLSSPYAVKKHLFIALTLALVALARIFAARLPQLKFPVGVVAACASAAIVSIILHRPGVSLYPMARAVHYAERAVESGLPQFQPGNTFAVNASLHPVVRYLISVSAFQADVGFGKSVGLITGTFTPQRDASFVMVDRTPELAAKCGERYAETSTFMIVPSACLQ